MNRSNCSLQLLGPPQTLVPVAIGRPAPGQNGVPQLAVPLTDPLLIHRGLCGVIQTPSKLQFTIGDLAVTIPIMPIEMRFELCDASKRLVG